MSDEIMVLHQQRSGEHEVEREVIPPEVAELAASVSGIADADLAAVDAWWRAANYLTVAQIYLMANPLLRHTLISDHAKPRPVGHWGAGPTLSFVYAHASRLARLTAQPTIFLAGPAHAGAVLTAATWLEGSYTEAYPRVGLNKDGLLRMFRQYAGPGGISDQVSAATPGALHGGAEPGYVLLHAFGAVLDDPGLLAVAVIGDGEAETAPLEGSWKGISFLNPGVDGAVLPVLHLASGPGGAPGLLARKEPAELRGLLAGHGYQVEEVAGSDLPGMHQRFAAALAGAWARIRAIQLAGTGAERTHRPLWPMIVLRTPSGWTGPQADTAVHGGRADPGRRVPVNRRAPVLPLGGVRNDPARLAELETWLRGYRPEELFDTDGAPEELVCRANPGSGMRMSAAPQANGGQLAHDLTVPDPRRYAVEVSRRGARLLLPSQPLGGLLRELYTANPKRFRMFCPEGTSIDGDHEIGGLAAVLEVSGRAWQERIEPGDVGASPAGRVMEVLSEHSCHGWLEGYTLTGRHGLLATSEDSAMVSVSQTLAHAQWLQQVAGLSWRASVPSLTMLLTSTVWRGGGACQQGPGLLQNMVDHEGTTCRVFLPPDANCLLAVAEQCLRARSHVNVIVVDDQPRPQWLRIDEAIRHCGQGAGIWDWAGTDEGAGDPDVVLACAGDALTAETIAAAAILREHLPRLRVRVVNVVDLMSLPRRQDHPHGMDDMTFRELFTRDVEVLFAFHGYPAAIHRLVRGRPNPERFRVRGYTVSAVATTAFDTMVRNGTSRFHLVMDALAVARRTPRGAGELREWCEAKLTEHHSYVADVLDDLPELSVTSSRFS